MSAANHRPDDSVQNAFNRLASHLRRQVIGQDALIDGLLIGLLAAGHLLLEGPPGVAKTRAVRILAGLIDADTSTRRRSRSANEA